MLWQALSRMVIVRLMLLVAIASTGPVAGPAAWHTLDSQEHRVGLLSSPEAPTTLAPGALPYAGATHCAACAFGATLRAWSPVAPPLLFAPLPQEATQLQPSAASLQSPVASAKADRAPPRLA